MQHGNYGSEMESGLLDLSGTPALSLLKSTMGFHNALLSTGTFAAAEQTGTILDFILMSNYLNYFTSLKTNVANLRGLSSVHTAH